MGGDFLDFWRGIKIPTKDVPQANRLNVVIRITCKINSWPVSSKEIADLLGYKSRQGSYYADAAELLGLIMKQKGGWGSTHRGQHLCSCEEEQRMRLLREYAIQIPIVSIALRLVESRGSAGIRIDDLIKEMRVYSDLDKSTPRRRVECIMSWLQQLDLVKKVLSKQGCFVHHAHDPQHLLF